MTKEEYEIAKKNVLVWIDSYDSFDEIEPTLDAIAAYEREHKE